MVILFALALTVSVGAYKSTDSTSETQITVQSEDSSDLLPFGFTPDEFVEDFINIGSFCGILVNDVQQMESSTWYILVDNPDGDDIGITLLTDYQGKVITIDVQNNDSPVFPDIAMTVISSSDSHLDADELNKTLNFSSLPETIENARLETSNGISLMLTDQNFILQRDNDTADDYEYTEIQSKSKGETELEQAENTNEADNSSDGTDSNVPTEYNSALSQAVSYSDTLHLSKQGIYDQLVSEYGGQFSAEAAQYAVDNVQADWNANALASAESYNDTLHLSKQGLYDLLVSAYGGQFTPEEAQYAIDNIQVDWNANVLEAAKSYQETLNMSPEAIRDHLTSEYGGQFIQEEADYAVANLPQ